MALLCSTTYQWAVVVVEIYLQHASINSDLIEQGQMTNIADNILCFDANNKSIILMLSNFLTDVLR